jgi:rubrerythrin
MKSICVHSCKGLCAALEMAEHLEQAAIGEYRRFADDCDYPEVRIVLNELVREREKALQLLVEKRQVLAAKFDALDRITDSFRE